MINTLNSTRLGTHARLQFLKIQGSGVDGWKLKHESSAFAFAVSSSRRWGRRMSSFLNHNHEHEDDFMTPAAAETRCTIELVASVQNALTFYSASCVRGFDGDRFRNA